MSITTAIATIDTVLVPSSPILEPQSSSSNSKRPFAPSKYFGNATTQTGSENGCGRAVVEDSFGVRLHDEENEQWDAELPVLEHIFKRGRIEREKPQGKRDDIDIARKDMGTVYRKGRRKNEDGATSSMTSQEPRIEDRTDKVVPVVIDSSSQGAEESIYFNSTSDRGVANFKMASERSIEPITKPFQAREEERERILNSSSASKSKGAKTTTINEKNPKSKRRGQRKDARSAKNVLDTTEGVAQGERKPKRAIKKKADGESQCTIKGTRISKPGTKQERSSEKDSETRKSRNSQSASKKPESDKSRKKSAALRVLASEEASENLATLGIDKAIPRRHNWTPTKQRTTADAAWIVDKGDRSPSVTQKSLEDSQKAHSKFDKLVGTFSYPIPYDSSTTSEVSRFTFEGSTKRRKLEV